MVFQCGTLSHVVEVDENDVIWQLPPKKSVVRWPTSSSIATTISEVGKHGKHRPRGILKSSIKIRIQDGDDARDCSSSPRSPQSSSSSSPPPSILAGREDSCDEYYPLAHLENAGNTPRGNYRPQLPTFASSSPHRRGRIRSEATMNIHDSTKKTCVDDENNNKYRHDDHQRQPESTKTRTKHYKKENDKQFTRRRRNPHHQHHHRHPTACPVCSEKLAYFQITPNNHTDEQQTNTYIDNQSPCEVSTAAALAPSATLREIKRLDKKEEEYHESLKNMCKMQLLLPPLCKTCKTYMVFDDTECKYDMMDNFERWYLDTADVAVDDDGDEGAEELHEVMEEGGDVTTIDLASTHNSRDRHLHRLHAKIIVFSGDDTPPSSPNPSSPQDADFPIVTVSADVADSATITTTANTATTATSTIAPTPTAHDVSLVTEEECDESKKSDDDALHKEDNITPRLSNCVGRKTSQTKNVQCSFERGEITSAPEQLLLANSSTSESIQLISTESEERKILEDYSITKEIASTQLVKELMKGHCELVQSVCYRCQMPQIKRNGDTHDIICATCPGVRVKAKWIANQKRTGKTAEAQQHKEEHPGRSTEDDDGSAVVAATDTLVLQMETKKLNALEEGLMGSNSNGECSDGFEMSSQRSTHDHTDYWVRHSSSRLNDQSLSNPPSFHSQYSNTIQVHNSNIHHSPTTERMQVSASELSPGDILYPNQHITASCTDVSKPRQSNSDESSTRCPLFSSSHDALYRLEDEFGLPKGSGMGQQHHIHKTMDQHPILDDSQCRSSNHLLFDTREVHNSSTIDGMICQVEPSSITATVDVPCIDPNEHYEGYGTFSDESSTRCPTNLPSNDMIWQYARHDISVDPMHILCHERESLNECDFNSWALPNEYEKDHRSIQNPRTVGRKDTVRGYDRLGSHFNSNYQISNNSELSSEESARRSLKSNVTAQLSSTNFCDTTVPGGMANRHDANNHSNSRSLGSHTYHRRQCIISDDSEVSSEVSQIEGRDIKINATNRESLHYDYNGRTSQEHYAFASKVPNEREEIIQSILTSKTLGRHADSVRAQSQEHQCNNKHRSSEDSVESSEVSQIQQHLSCDEHFTRNVAPYNREVIENNQTSSRVDIGVRIARLATSLRIFQHELPLNRNRMDTKDDTFTIRGNVDIQKKVRTINHTTYPEIQTPKDSVASSVVFDMNESKYQSIQNRISPVRDVLGTENRKRNASNIIHHPICFWPLTDKIENSSHRIPISPIAIGRRDRQTSEGVPTNNFFMKNNCDCSNVNEHRADPPGFHIENLEHRESGFGPSSRKAKHDLHKTAKSANNKVVLSEDSTRLKMQKDEKGTGRYAGVSRDSVTPKSTGRSSSTVVHTQEADENCTSLLRVKSWGESSVDKLMKQIDEIEDDFISIVASLPGSKDGTSLMSSTNSLKSGNAHSLVEITLNIADSFDSHSSAVSLVTDAVHRMRRIKDCIYQNDSTDECGGSDEGSYNSRGGMSELIQDLNNAAESLRTLSEWDE